MNLQVNFDTVAHPHAHAHTHYPTHTHPPTEGDIDFLHYKKK